VVAVVAAIGAYAAWEASLSDTALQSRRLSALVSAVCVGVLAYGATMAGGYALRARRQPRTLPTPSPDAQQQRYALRRQKALIFVRRSRAQEQRSRTWMLDRVRNAWIKGVLEESLGAIAWIELGLERRPEAVRHPAALVARWPTGQARALPADMSIDAVFDELGSALLILGAPGSGKTTLLLELTRRLLDRTANDPSYPMPVVFNLSSWAAERPSLAEWLVGELVDSYQIPRNLAQQWVDAEQVLPLLDGLDEVATEHRQECVEVINAFRAEHGLLQMAVCSRTEEYEQLLSRQQQLRLLGAIAIQPLTRQQVTKYLQQAGEPLAGVRTALRDDETLWELLATPLLLSIVALAYKGKPAAAVRALGTLPERRAHLFATYTEAMFERRTPVALYPREQTLWRLAWLARTMQRFDQSVFHLELMQPDWLPSPQQQRIVTQGVAGAVGLTAGLVTGLVTGLGAWAAEGVYPGGFDPVLTGLIFGLAAALFFGLFVAWAAYEQRIQPAERMSWSWAEARARRAFGLTAGLIAGLGGGLVFWRTFPWIVGLIASLGFGLAGWLVTMLASGLTSKMRETRTSPNEGIRRSARNAVGVGLTAGLVLGLLIGMIFGRAFTWVVGLNIGGAVGITFGLAVGLREGGGAVLRHLALRMLLVRNKFVPWRYVEFLEYATARIFLRRAGGGYIFVHRLLQEHFATLGLKRPQ
jgi:hypothetical protein